MTNAYEPQSEHEYEQIGRIRGTGDQVVVYYNHTTLRVEIYIEKFEDSLTRIVKLALSIEETKKLVELLEKSTIRMMMKVHDGKITHILSNHNAKKLFLLFNPRTLR
jgi:hypothetical protein